MAVASYYPPSPRNVPVDLTEPTPAYRQQVTLVLISVVIFLLLYFGLMFLSGLLVYKLLTWELAERNHGGIVILRIILIMPCALLFLFLLKNLFKRETAEKTYDVEIFEDEHPRLFDFISRLCDETQAPHPHRVFINYEVNAGVSYDKSLFHLFWPAPKNLTVGLGLVNAVNLTEFKAMLAHEFGHVTQKSMKLGSYAYGSLRIIHNLVYGYDWMDRLLDRWCCLDIRISWPAWMFYGVLWLLRKLLAGMLEGIMFLERAMSRQMEFNADLMAVSVTGSDAPVHLLCKSYFADQCLGLVFEELQMARDHDLLTSDLFYHLDKAATHVRKKAKNPNLGVPPPLPADERDTTQVFKPEDDELAAMWATHPSNYDREENAKYDYIRSEFDERTAWVLFDDLDKLRERITVKFYRHVFRAPRELMVSTPEKVQAFIDEEHAETTYDPKYQGLYDHRKLMPGDIHEASTLARSWSKDLGTLAQLHAGTYSAEVKHRAQLYNRRHEESEKLLAIANGWERPKNGEFEFRGEWYDLRDAKRLLKKLDKEYEKDEAWMEELDRKVFEINYQMALQLNPLWATELFKRYEFHLDVQKIWQRLRDQEGPVGSALQFLSNSKGDLHYDDFREVIRIFRNAHLELKDGLRIAEDMYFPPLANMPAGQPVRPFLLAKKLVYSLSRSETSLPGKWIDRFLKQYREVQSKVNRLHFKSMGGILSLQETITAEALRRTTAARPVTAAPSGPPRLPPQS
ncbi:MAG: M48 family metallopeptidase [Gemmataceae bacterium]|nr:M48 family metallopeptidase [Gemmataceae bacterium]